MEITGICQKNHGWGGYLCAVPAATWLGVCLNLFRSHGFVFRIHIIFAGLWLLPLELLVQAWVPQRPRPRRNRKSEAMRSMVRENVVRPANFIYPLFIHEEVSGTVRTLVVLVALRCLWPLVWPWCLRANCCVVPRPFF